MNYNHTELLHFAALSAIVADPDDRLRLILELGRILNPHNIPGFWPIWVRHCESPSNTGTEIPSLASHS